MCSAALTCAQPRPTDAIERGCVEKAPTATGELPDGVRGKRAQFDLGSGGELREPRLGNANRLRGDCRRKVLWEVDAVRPGSVVVDLGSRVERGANGPRRLYRRPARVNGEPTAQLLRDRAAGMRNRTKRREHSDRVVPAFDSGQESKAQSIDRITQREGAYPCWADRSESSARSYAAVPGPGMDPPGF